MIKLLSIIKEDYNFEDSCVDYNNGQSYMKLKIFDDKKNSLGYLAYSDYNDDAYIDLLYVEPEYRRNGVGTLLMNKLKELYKNHKIEKGYTTDDGNKFLNSDKLKEETKRNVVGKSQCSVGQNGIACEKVEDD